MPTGAYPSPGALARLRHLFGGGSSTEPGREGYWMLDVEDHKNIEVAHFRPGRERAHH